MKGLTLFKRRNQSQSLALVQVPSTDLIKSDTEPELPKMVEIECQQSPDELARYMELIHHAGYQSSGLKTEGLCHLLKRLGYKQYDQVKLSEFKDKITQYIGKKEHAVGHIYMSEERCDYILYNDPIPPRIVNKINKIRSHFIHPDDLRFKISWLLNSRYTHRKAYYDVAIGICFLHVLVNGGLRVFIIDAWRGPTFSDEEARLP